MIITKLMGGLGNQMFQYAAGRSLADKLDTELKLDLSWFGSGMYPTPRAFELDGFNITEGIATEDEICGIKGRLRVPRSKAGLLVSKILDRKDAKTNPSYLYEGIRNIESSGLTPNKDYYLEGYWQSEKYFADIRNKLLNSFTIKESAGKEYEELLAQIKNENSLAVHIRRGDYISVSRIRKRYSVCNTDYYRRAAELIKSKEGQVKAFIFSDDPDWAARNFEIGFPQTIILTGTSVNACSDLLLMSQCRNFIIANSSFSWWGAWLSQNPEKIVVSPDSWTRGHSSEGIVPPDWISI